MADENKIKITGRLNPMPQYGVRIPQPEAVILDSTAKDNGCSPSDLLRTAWKEFISNHGLKAKK